MDQKTCLLIICLESIVKRYVESFPVIVKFLCSFNNVISASVLLICLCGVARQNHYCHSRHMSLTSLVAEPHVELILTQTLFFLEMLWIFFFTDRLLNVFFYKKYEINNIFVGFCIHTERLDTPAEQSIGTDVSSRLMQAYSVSSRVAYLLLETL